MSRFTEAEWMRAQAIALAMMDCYKTENSAQLIMASYAIMIGSFAATLAAHDEYGLTPNDVLQRIFNEALTHATRPPEAPIIN